MLTVIGICTYQPAVARWLHTLRAHFDGPCRLYLVNAPEPLGNILAQKFDCTVVPVRAAPDYWTEPSPGRFCRTWGHADPVVHRPRQRVHETDPRHALLNHGRAEQNNLLSNRIY